MEEIEDAAIGMLLTNAFGWHLCVYHGLPLSTQC